MPHATGEIAVAKKQTEIVISSKASQLAKGWVRNMLGESDSGSESEDPKSLELEARPPRLGLGAKYLPHSKVAATMSPVEKKLRIMTSAGRHQRDGGDRIGKHKPAVSNFSKESKSDSEHDEEEEEVKGSSRIPDGRQQRRIGPADLLLKIQGSKGRGSKRKR